MKAHDEPLVVLNSIYLGKLESGKLVIDVVSSDDFLYPFVAYAKFYAAWQIAYAVENVNVYDKICKTLKKLNFQTDR